MKKLLFISLIFSFYFQFSQQIAAVKGTDTNGFEYVSYDPDPLKARVYTLANGLKVYLTTYKDQPKIQTFVAVRAGSKFDPASHTGLAHYLEHLMFKGTKKIGTSNWEEEAPLLDEIEALYEVYGQTTDIVLRDTIYTQIDALSLAAAKYAIPNEYDRIVSEMGATGTNAYTSFEQTVYVNEIPANEIEKWVITEAERFSTFVPRLFHTELETVYEEKNRTLDNDYRQLYEKLFKGLFPHHQYGTQTTIGTVNDLKNPSIKAIRAYFNAYYVPNNMAICLSGDLDIEKTILLIDQSFGGYTTKTLPTYEAPQETPIKKIMRDSVFGPNAEMLALGYRFPGFSTKESMLSELVSMLLSNGEAGLIDINLNQKQLIQGGSSYSYRLNDYSMHILGGMPMQGQTIQEVEMLLNRQIEKLKTGDFDAWLLKAIVNDYKKGQIEAYESNKNRAQAMLASFVYNQDWGVYINEINELQKITKEDIVQFVNDYYHDNYVVIYKRQGEVERAHIEKPAISQLPINRETHSTFYQQVTSKKVNHIKPVFADFSKIVSTSLNHDLPLKYLKNTENDLFDLYYMFDFGSLHDPELALAIRYLNYIGSDKYSAETLQKEFYKIGCSFNVSVGSEKTYVSLSGLAEHLEEGLALFEAFLKSPLADQEAYNRLISKIEKSRTDAKSNKATILKSAMVSYAKYGKESPFTDKLSVEELQKITPESLTKKIEQLIRYPHQILYYGPQKVKKIQKYLNKYHKTTSEHLAMPDKKSYKEKPLDKPTIYFVNYEMVQAEVIMLSKSVPYDYNIKSKASVFNEYFGGNMSAIVFQEIREARALAYSVSSRYSTSTDTTKSNYMVSYIGTQSDKLPEALSALNTLLDELPLAENVFENSMTSLKKQVATSRTTKSSLFFKEESAKRLGKSYDTNIDLNNYYQKVTLQDVQKFHETYIENQPKTYLIIGKRETIDWEAMKELGEIKELKLDTLFGY